MRKKQEPYPYKLKEYTLDELRDMKKKSSCRQYNIFHDYNYIIYNLVLQLIELKEEKGSEGE